MTESLAQYSAIDSFFNVKICHHNCSLIKIVCACTKIYKFKSIYILWITLTTKLIGTKIIDVRFVAVFKNLCTELQKVIYLIEIIYAKLIDTVAIRQLVRYILKVAIYIYILAGSKNCIKSGLLKTILELVR